MKKSKSTHHASKIFYRVSFVPGNNLHTGNGRFLPAEQNHFQGRHIYRSARVVVNSRKNQVLGQVTEIQNERIAPLPYFENLMRVHDVTLQQRWFWEVNTVVFIVGFNGYYRK